MTMPLSLCDYALSNPHTKLTKDDLYQTYKLVNENIGKLDADIAARLEQKELYMLQRDSLEKDFADYQEQQ